LFIGAEEPGHGLFLQINLYYTLHKKSFPIGRCSMQNTLYVPFILAYVPMMYSQQCYLQLVSIEVNITRLYIMILRGLFFSFLGHFTDLKCILEYIIPSAGTLVEENSCIQ
jgi:hypothetical protein